MDEYPSTPAAPLSLEQRVSGVSTVQKESVSTYPKVASSLKLFAQATVVPALPCAFQAKFDERLTYTDNMRYVQRNNRVAALYDTIGVAAISAAGVYALARMEGGESGQCIVAAGVFTLLGSGVSAIVHYISVDNHDRKPTGTLFLATPFYVAKGMKYLCYDLWRVEK